MNVVNGLYFKLGQFASGPNEADGSIDSVVGKNHCPLVIPLEDSSASPRLSLLSTAPETQEPCPSVWIRFTNEKTTENVDQLIQLCLSREGTRLNLVLFKDGTLEFDVWSFLKVSELPFLTDALSGI